MNDEELETDPYTNPVGYMDEVNRSAAMSLALQACQASGQRFGIDEMIDAADKIFAFIKTGAK